MKSFLVLVDSDGSIIEIQWCDPITLIYERTESIQDIFEFNHHEAIHSAILNCSIDAAKLSYLENQRLSIDQINLKLCFMKSNNGVYVFAVEQHFCFEPKEHDHLQKLISRFMLLIQQHDHKMGFKKPESTRFQFEEIQLLNNELVNTKRMLEKSNGQLNQLNRELNNRLVKDPLTGLVSRYQYRAEIEYQISQHQGKLGVFMFMDIDDFKKINDTYGHRVGDDYLVEFANRLHNIPLPNSIKLRIAGDEFGLFVYGLKKVDSHDLVSLWDLIKHHILSEPFIIDHKKLAFSLSVGMAIYGVDTKEVYEIIEYADYAMYCAKRSGKNRYSRFNFEEYEKEKLENRAL